MVAVCTMYVPVTIARDDGTRPTETQASGESSAHTASHNTQPHHSHTPLYKNFIPGCPKISFNSGIAQHPCHAPIKLQIVFQKLIT